MEKSEKCLLEILKEQYDFKPHVYDDAATPYQEFRELWLPNFWLKLFPIKTVKKSSDEWLSATINGNFYEVLMVDIWYVELRINGETVFSERRFNNDDFLRMLA